MTAAQMHRRRAKTVLREDPCDRTPRFERQQGQVAPVDFADTGFGNPKGNAGNGKKLLGSGGWRS